LKASTDRTPLHRDGDGGDDQPSSKGSSYADSAKLRLSIAIKERDRTAAKNYSMN